MITPSFALTATERVLPKLALDFTTAVLDPRVTFTRVGDTATVINSSGLVASVLANVPRFDYDPTTLVCKGLLIEESRTNLYTYSANLNDASWTKSNCSTSANQAVAPDGTTTAARATFSANGLLYKNTVPNAAGTYTITAWVKSATGSNQNMRFFGNGATTYSNLLVVTTSWQRLSFTYTYASATSGFWTESGQPLDIYIWGAQVEAGAFPTSYIPTTTTALTRNADVATMTGANFSDWFNASEGTFTLTSIAGTNVGYASGAYTQRGIEVSSATNAYMTIARLNTATTARLLVVDSTTQVAIDQSNYTQNTASTFTFGYKLNNYVFAGNGAAVTTDTAATVPVCSTLNIGKATTAEGFLNGWIRKINYYPMRLTNAEVQAFSKG